MKKASQRFIALTLSAGLCWQAWGQGTAAIAITQLPTGGKVVGGQATVQSTGNTLNVNQSSQRGVVEWNTFNIGSNATVNFIQPSANSVTLNRVMDMNASQILGRISATGQVFISNPNGVIFGTSAQVDVGGLVATSKSIANADFMNGQNTFEGNGQVGSVINQGTLQAALGGYIALLAPQVRNEGVIVAREGTVALASGDKTTLEFSGTKLTSVLVERPVMDALVENKQLIRAEGGYVVLSARSVNALLGAVIKQSGVIEAPSLVQREGRILLEGGDKGVVSVSGGLNVSGMQEGAVGGRIVVTGDKVALSQGAQLDATGNAGGGKINVGGGWQGQDPSIRQAKAVIVEAGSRLDASAVQTGNGGEVVVWSDIKNSGGMTQVAGDIKARGGVTQGDGGRIETSGYWLSTQGATGDASAPRGAAGQWLFDPYDVTITSATQNNTLSSGTWTPTSTGSTILNTSINSLLDAGTNVTVSTGSSGAEAGNISVNADITQNPAATAARLSLTANKDITIHNPISLSKSGSKLELNAGNAISGGNVVLTGAVTSDTLSMNLTGAGSVTQGASLSSAVSVNNLRISGTGTQVVLQNDYNNVGVFTANVASVKLRTQDGIDLGSIYGKGLSIDTVEGMSGVTATGDIQLESRNGNIFVNQNISTGSINNTAIQLNAGEALSPGANTGSDSAANPYGPNIVLTSGKTITTGSGGRATLFSGSGSGGGATMSAYVSASGSGRFRYNSDEASTNYSAPLSSGLYAILRQNPTLTVSANSTSMVYGAAITPATSSTITGYLNADSQAVSVSNPGTIAISGARSTAGYLTGGDHVLTPSGAQGDIGYGFAYANGTLGVSKKILVIGATASNKTYDATTAATTALTSDKEANDVVTLNKTSSTFTNKNVGTGKTVTVSGLSISGADADNYSLSSTNATTTANITQKTLAATYMASDKVYDGATTASVTGSSVDILSGDTVTLTKSAATFSDKNVGSAKTVTVSGIAISGTDAANYLLSNTSTTTTASISPKSLTAAFAASQKTYDGNATATVTASSSQIVGSDAVTITNASASFDNKNVGDGKTVTVSGIAISGAGASNYSLSNLTATTTANITPKSLTISGITAANKIYDGTTAATVDITGVSKRGLIVGDQLDVSTTGVFTNKNVGIGKNVTLTNSYSGLDVGNYSITSQSSATANVTSRLLAVTAVVRDKTYDATRTATDYSLYSDQVVGDVLTLSANSALFDTKNVGTGKTITLAGIAVSGTDAGNYTLQNGSTTTKAAVTSANLSVTGVTAANKTYDGTVYATLSGTPSLTTLQTDVVNLVGTSVSTFADKNVGVGKTVTTTGYSLSGADAGNYNLITPTLTANITKANLAVTAVADSKTYDGTLTSSNTPIYSLVAGDSLTAPVSQAYTDKNSGTNKTIRANGISIVDGANVNMTNNYNITYVDNNAGVIAKKAVTLDSITADSKTYNGSAAAAVSSGVISGTVGLEELLISGTGAFSDKNAAIGKTVTVADVTTLTKTNSTGDWNNYNLTTTGAKTTTANIYKKNVSLDSITADNKAYDGSAVANISSGVISGVVGSEALLVSGSGAFPDKNAASSMTVTVADVTALTKTSSTGDWNNYNLITTGAITTTANINKKAVTLDSITAESKTYDASAAAKVSSGVISGTVGSEALLISGSGAFSDKNAAIGKTVTVADVTALTKTNSTGDWNNYNLTTTGAKTTTANINKKNVSLDSITADSKPYDGSAVANISSGVISGVVGSEALLISGSGAFPDKNAASSMTVTVADVTALTKTSSTGDWNNYNLITTGAKTATASINKANLVVIAAADSKTYDGTFTSSLTPSYSLAPGDLLTAPASQAYTDKNAGANKTIRANGINIVDSANVDMAGNYNITYVDNTTSVITKKPVILSSITADTKNYDTSSTVNIASGNIVGLVGNESLQIRGTGTYDSINIGYSKVVTVQDVAQLAKVNGTGDWSNYNLTTTGGMKTTGSIIPITNNCTRANANGCISTDTSPVAKIAPVASVPVPLSLNIDKQLVKRSVTTTAQPSATVISNSSVVLTAPLTSMTLNVNTLSPAQVSELSSVQLVSLMKSLDIRQLQAITEKQMRDLTLSQLEELIGLLNRAARSALAPTTVLPPTLNVRALSPAQVSELSSVQLVSLMKFLDIKQLQAITEKQMRDLTMSQLEELIGLLNRAAGPAFPPPPAAATMLNVRALSPAQVSELYPQQLASLMKLLDIKQLQAITEKQMRDLNTGQLDELIGLLNRVANSTN